MYECVYTHTLMCVCACVCIHTGIYPYLPESNVHPILITKMLHLLESN